MADIYSRMREIGFNRKYLVEYIFPDWWEDSMASNPVNRRQIELIISKLLGMPLHQLANPSSRLESPSVGEARFKHWTSTNSDQLKPAVAVCRHVAHTALSVVTGIQKADFSSFDPLIFRENILKSNRYVDLQNLVSSIWELGIPVFYVERLPKGAKRVDGMVLNVDQHTVIILASSRKSSAWLIWHLAHELGHIVMGHLNGGDNIDVVIGGANSSTENEENEANNIASSIIYGEHGSKYFSHSRMPGKDLAKGAISKGEEMQVLPASIVASYAYNMKAWGAAQKALYILGDVNGADVISKETLSRISIDELNETEYNFVVNILGLTV